MRRLFLLPMTVIALGALVAASSPASYGQPPYDDEDDYEDEDTPPTFVDALLKGIQDGIDMNNRYKPFRDAEREREERRQAQYNAEVQRLLEQKAARDADNARQMARLQQQQQQQRSVQQAPQAGGGASQPKRGCYYLDNGHLFCTAN